MIPVLHIGVAFSFFAIIFFLCRRRLRPENIISSVFLLFLALPILTKLIVIGAVNLPVPREFLSMWKYPFTYGPLLYLYAKAEIDTESEFKKKNLLHFIPFVLLALLPFFYSDISRAEQLPSFGQYGHHMQGNFENRKFLSPSPPSPGRQMNPEMPGPGEQGRSFPPERDLRDKDFPAALQILAVLLVISFISYTILVFRLIQKHKKKITDYFSYDSIRLNLKWVQWITLAFVVSYSFVFLSTKVKPSIYTHPLLRPETIPDIATTFFIMIFFFFSIKQPVIFSNADSSGKPEEIQDKPEEIQDKPEEIQDKPEEIQDKPEEDNKNNGLSNERKKYQKSGLKDTEAAVYLKKLETVMTDEKPYLNCSLTLEDMSKMLNIPRHHLTQVLNEKLNKNFFMFVNEYRVMEAKQMMENQEFKEYSIIRIAYDSGFNSKSGFNTVFKKLTGHTPTEYRNSTQ